MTPIIQKLLAVVLGITGIALLFFAIQSGLDKQANVTCIKLQNQSQEYPNFFITEYEKKICDSVGIEIDAEVRLFSN